MRRTFIAGAKLLGLYIWYQTLSALAYLVFPAMSFFSKTSRPSVEFSVLGWVVPLIVGAVAGWLLVCRTSRIADAVDIPEDAPSLPLPPLDRLLRWGIVLLGLYAFVFSAPRAIADIASVLLASQEPSYFLNRTLGYVLQSAFGIVLMLYPGRIIQRIQSWETVPPPSPAAQSQQDEEVGEDAGATTESEHE